MKAALFFIVGVFVVLPLRIAAQGMMTIKADYENVEFAKLPSGKSLTLNLYLPKTVSANALVPVVVYIHPGGWSSGSSAQGAEHAAYLTTAGFAVASINYRLSNDSVYPAQIHDCKGAVRWLRANATRYNLDARYIGAFGHSAGAHLASLVGVTRDVKMMTSGAITMDIEGAVGGNTQHSSAVQAVADFFGPSNLVEFYKITTQGSGSNLVGCTIAMCSDKALLASPTSYATRTRTALLPPFLIMHGTADDVVPFSQSQLLDSVLRLAGATVTFTSVQGASHGFDAAWSKPEIQTAVINFFTKYLKSTTSVGVSTQTNNNVTFAVFPNPASDNVRVNFTLIKPECVKIALYNALGQELAQILDAEMGAGEQTVQFSAQHLALNTIFIRLQTNTFSQTKPVQVLR